MRYIHSALFIMCLAISSIANAKYTILTTDMPPYVIDKGKSGIAIDITRELFKRANLDFVIKNMPLARAVKQVEDNKEYCVVPIQRSQERETKFKWISPVLVTQSSLLSPIDANIDLAVLGDARPYKIGVLRGSAVQEYLEGSGFEFKVEAANSEEKNAKKLAKDRIQLWAADAIAGPYYADKAKSRVKQQIIFRSTLRALACNLSTDDELTEKLTSILKSMYADGTVLSIFKKYTEGLDIGDLGQFLQ